MKHTFIANKNTRRRSEWGGRGGLNRSSSSGRVEGIVGGGDGGDVCSMQLVSVIDDTGVGIGLVVVVGLSRHNSVSVCGQRVL